MVEALPLACEDCGGVGPRGTRVLRWWEVPVELRMREGYTHLEKRNRNPTDHHPATPRCGVRKDTS